MTEFEEIEVQEPEQQEPEKPIQKLYKVVKDKGLYTKSYDEFIKQYSTPESKDKLYKVVSDEGLYTKTRQDFDSQYFKKKASVDFSGSSLQAGNALSNGVGGEEIPTIEMYTTPSGEMVDTNPISLSKKYRELSNRTKEQSTIGGGSFAMGTTTESVPDEEAQKSAKKLQEDFPNIDFEGISEELKDIPDEVLQRTGNELMQDREQNNPLYQRKLANIKWRSGFEKQLLDYVDNGYLKPEEYNNIKHGIEQLPISTGEGNFTNQRSSIKSMSDAIRLFGGEKKDEILKDFAVEVSKVYGNAYDNKFSDSVKDSPESKYLNEDEQLGLHFLKDVDPDKAKQYERILVDPKTYKDNPDAVKGANHLHQVLEETSLGLQQNAVTEEMNNLSNIAKRNEGLTPEQLQQAEKLEKRQEEINVKRNELDKKYPERKTDKVSDAVNEIMGHDLNWGEYAMVKTGQALTNTGKGIWEAVSSPFMSDQSNSLRELEIMGESITDEKNLKQPDKNKALQYDKLVIEPDLQKQVDEIKNDKSLNEEQKRSKLFSLFYDNTDKFGRVPIQNGKWNINPSSILYGLTDLATTLVPFIGLEAVTGGIGGVGTGAKFLRTFTAAAATTFHDEYAAAIQEGKPQSEAYKRAMYTTAINSAAMAGAGTPTEVRAMLGSKSSAAKIIARLSDAEIKKVMAEGTPKGLRAIGQSLKNRVKATPALIGQGLKTGAKFETAMAGASELTDREHDWKQAVLSTANFGLLGGGLGHIGYKSPTELQKGGMLEMGKNGDGFRATLDEMKKNGQLNEAEFAHRKDLIDKSEEAYKVLPKANDKGQPLDEKQKAEYIYNSVIKNEGKKAAVNLPPKQAEKAEHTAMVADFKNGILLETPTDNQLNSRQSKLEKELDKKDENGKLELTDTERKKAEAELEAVNNELETRKSFEKVEMNRRDIAPKPTDVVVDAEQQSGKDGVVDNTTPKGNTSNVGGGATEIKTENENTQTSPENPESIPSKEEGSTAPVVSEVIQKTGKYEEKARKLAEKIQEAELPSWMKIEDPNVKKSGAGADELKKALADATIKMGKLLDKGVEFSEAVKEAVKDLVNMLGEDARNKIEEGFAKDYKNETNHELSGIKKALVSDKIIEGVDLERIGDKEMMALGRKILDTGEVKPEALVTKIITDGKGVLTPTEVVGLITYKRDIDTALQDTYKQLAEKRANGEDIGTLGVEAKNLERQQNDFDVMAVITAQQQSMAFRLRQRMLDREYNVVTQIEKYKANNNGEIPADVEARFREIDKELKEVKAKLVEAEKAAADKEAQAAVDNIKESVGREKIYTEEELQTELKKERISARAEKKEKVHKAIDDMMDKWAKKVSPEHLRGTDTKGANAEKVFKSVGAIMKKAYDAGEVTAKIVEDAVNYISKKLGRKDWGIEEFRKENWDEKLKSGTERKANDKPTINEDGTVKIPNQMLRDLVKRGITDIEGLTKEVHNQVKKDLPDVTERQVRDAITDYGKEVNKTADELQTQVNTAKRVGRLLSELEDIRTMGKIEFLAKYKKPKPSESKISERERELRTQIKALGKDIVGDVSKGTKESDNKHQTRIENLEKELLRIQERRKKEPQEKNASTREIPADEKALLDEIEAEQTKWDAEKDAARQASNDYGKMETERNRQLKRVGELNDKIETLRKGELPETKKVEPKKDTPEIEALKAEKDALEKSVREGIAHEKKMKDLDAELQRLKDRKEKEPKPDSKRVISQEESLKRDEIEAERKSWDVEKNIGKLKTELQRVRDRQKKVTNPKDRRELTDTEKDLVKQIKAEQEVWNKEIEPAKKVMEALKAAQKSLTEYERRIAEKDFSKKDTNATPETPELKALREKRDAKRKEYEKLKKDTLPKIEKTEAERLKAAKESAQRRIYELTTKIKNKDFAKPVKKLAVTDTELVKLNAEKERLQDEYDKEQYALEIKNRGFWKKWEDRAYEATSGLMRGLTLGVDLSAAGVQGMRRLFTNPKGSAIAFWEGLKHLVSEKGANDFMNKQKAQPYYPLLRATKLAIDDKSGKQSVKEGMFVSEWINLIWNKAVAPVAGLGTKWGTNFVRKINPYAASQRAYDGYVNSIRIQSYLKLANELSRDGYTYEADPKVFNKLADFVNTTTGRGSLGAADANSRWLNVFLTAPRKVISEVKLYTPYAFVYYAKMPQAVRMKALKDFVQFTGTFMAVNALVWASRKDWGNEEEGEQDNFWNMNSADFLTHKIGDKRISIGGGMKSILTMQSRFWSGNFTDQYGNTTKLGDRYGKPINTRLDLVTRFAIGKAAPIFNVAAKKLDERAGRPVENDEIIKNISVPLWLQDIGDLYKNDPNSVAPLLTAFSIIGANVRTVDLSKQPKNTLIENYTKPDGKELTDKDIKDFEETKQDIVDKNIEKLKNNGIGDTKYKDLTPEEISKEETYIKTSADNAVKASMFIEKIPTREEIIKDTKKDVSRFKNYDFTVPRKKQ